MTVYFAADATSSFIQFSCLGPGVSHFVRYSVSCGTEFSSPIKPIYESGRTRKLLQIRRASEVQRGSICCSFKFALDRRGTIQYL